MTMTPDFIPWPAIHPRYNWAARDSDGRIIAFEKRPELVDGRFSNGGHWQRIDTITTAKPGSVHWAGSVQNRDDWDTAETSAQDVSRYVASAMEKLSAELAKMNAKVDELQRERASENVMVRGAQLGGHASSFIDRVYSIGIDTGFKVEPTPSGGSRIVLRATPPPPND